MWFEDTDIRLRALEPEDLDWLYTLENDETLWGVGCSNVPYSRYALKSYIAESRHDIYADGQLRLVAVLKATGAVVGCVDLVDFSPRHLRAEVGIFLYPDYQNRGWGGRMLKMLVSYTREHLCLHQLYAWVAEENVQAQRLFQKSGFSRQAVLEGWLRDKKGGFTAASLVTLLL